MFDALGRALSFVLSFFYTLTHSYGFAIILLTVAVRLVLFPLTAKQMRSMQGMTKLQPELKKLQAEHKDDRLKLQEEMSALYKKEGVNPVGGCAPMLMQLPVFFGLFNVIRGLTNSGRLAGLQIQVPKPKYLSPSTELYRSIVRSGGRLFSFGFDLAQSASGITGNASKRAPYILLVAGYVVTAFLQQHLATRRNPQAMTGPNAQVQQIMKILPLFMGFFYYQMPAGLVLYFVASNLWTIAQQEVLNRAIPPLQTAPDVATSEAVVEVPSKLVKPSQTKLPLPKPAKAIASTNNAKAKPTATSVPSPRGAKDGGPVPGLAKGSTPRAKANNQPNGLQADKKKGR